MKVQLIKDSVQKSTKSKSLVEELLKNGWKIKEDIKIEEKPIKEVKKQPRKFKR